MSEKPPAIIPLAYRDKGNAGFVLICSFLALAGGIAQVWMRIVIGFEDALSVVILVAQVVFSPVWVFMALDCWHVLRGRPALYIQAGKLILRFWGGRRISLEKIANCTFEGIGSAYDPAAVTLQMRDAKPIILKFSHVLQPVPGFADILRRATAKA